MAMSNRHLCYNPYVWWAGCQRSQVRLGGLSVGTWLEGVPACEYPSRCSKLTKQERKSIPNSRERRERCIFPLSLSRSWPETHRNWLVMTRGWGERVRDHTVLVCGPGGARAGPLWNNGIQDPRYSSLFVRRLLHSPPSLSYCSL